MFQKKIKNNKSFLEWSDQVQALEVQVLNLVAKIKTNFAITRSKCSRAPF